MGACPKARFSAFIERLTQGGGPAPKNRICSRRPTLLWPRTMPPGGRGALRPVAVHRAGGDVQALAGLARCYVETGEIEQAKQTLALVPEAKRGDAAVAAARAAVELVEQAASVGPIGELEQKLPPTARSSGAVRSCESHSMRRARKRGARSPRSRSCGATRSGTRTARTSSSSSCSMPGGPTDEATLEWAQASVVDLVCLIDAGIRGG